MSTSNSFLFSRIDLERPIEVDDEDWPADPAAAFPPNSSSTTTVAYLNNLISLMTTRVEGLRQLVGGWI